MGKPARKSQMERASAAPAGSATSRQWRVSHARPTRREHCDQFERPCPYVGCRYHLYLEVRQGSGNIKFNFPGLEVWEMGETCALDAAEAGGLTLTEIGRRLNLTRERVRQIEGKALRKLAEFGIELEEFLRA